MKTGTKVYERKLEIDNSKLPSPFAPLANAEETRMGMAIGKVMRPNLARAGAEQYSLIVGRDRDFLEYYRRQLLALGFTTMNVSTHEAAVSCLRLLAFDLVVLDERNGASQYRRLLEQSRKLHPLPPVLVVTGCDDYWPDANTEPSGIVEYVKDRASSAEIARKVGGGRLKRRIL